MRLRFIHALIALCAWSMPALAQPPKPTVIASAKPLSRLFAEYREMLRQVGGPSQGDMVVKEFDRGLMERFGELGLEGIDINRPFAAYVVVNEKIEESNPTLIVPITGEKEFLAFLERSKIKATALKDKKGLYHLRINGLDALPKESHLQFVDGGWAYVGLNGDDVADAKLRLPLDGLFDDADQSLVTVKLFPGRFPEKLLKSWLDMLDGFANNMKGFLVAGGPKNWIKVFGTFLEEGPKLLHRYAELTLEEVDEVRLQFGFDPATGEMATELTVVPKPGSPLAKDIAAKPATTNRFASLVPASAAAGIVVKVPLFAKEIRQIVTALLEAIEAESKASDLPNSLHPFVEKLAKTAIDTVKEGKGDLALALAGPNRDGKFTLVGAVSLVDTAGLEKALREGAKPVELAKHFEFDADKVDGVAIHKVPLARMFHEEQLREITKVFGEKPPGYLAFAKDAAFISFGADGLSAIKGAVAAKPGKAAAVEITVNAKRLHKFIATTVGEDGAALFARIFAPEDVAANAFRFTVEGGPVLKAKAIVNLNYFPRLQYLP